MGFQTEELVVSGEVQASGDVSVSGNAVITGDVILEEDSYLTDRSYSTTAEQIYNTHNRPFTIDIQAGAWVEDPSSPSEHEDAIDSSGDMSVDWFDSATEEYNMNQIELPSDIDPSGNVTIEAKGLSKTYLAGAKICLTFHHRKIGDDESWQGSLTEVDFDTNGMAIESAWPNIKKYAKTVSIASLGWSGGDLIRIKFSRDSTNANDTLNSIDWGCVHFHMVVDRL